MPEIRAPPSATDAGDIVVVYPRPASQSTWDMTRFLFIRGVSLPISLVVMCWVYVMMIEGWGPREHNIVEFWGNKPAVHNSRCDSLLRDHAYWCSVHICVCTERREAFGNLVSIRACVHLVNRSRSGPRTNIMSCRTKCAWMWIRNQTCHKTVRQTSA